MPSRTFTKPVWKLHPADGTVLPMPDNDSKLLESSFTAWCACGTVHTVSTTRGNVSIPDMQIASASALSSSVARHCTLQVSLDEESQEIVIEGDGVAEAERLALRKPPLSFHWQMRDRRQQFRTLASPAVLTHLLSLHSSCGKQVQVFLAGFSAILQILSSRLPRQMPPTTPKRHRSPEALESRQRKRRQSWQTKKYSAFTQDVAQSVVAALNQQRPKAQACRRLVMWKKPHHRGCKRRSAIDRQSRSQHKKQRKRAWRSRSRNQRNL